MNLDLNVKDLLAASQSAHEAIDYLRRSFMALMWNYYASSTNWALTNCDPEYLSYRFVLRPDRD